MSEDSDSSASKTLSEYPALTPAEDFDALMEQSTGWLPNWCEDEWTDFNVHDPGIMVLEQLTYALTELPYRANLGIRRLLAGPDGRIPWDANSLYAPTDVLPMRALTAGDYARLLYDSLRADGRPALVYASVAAAPAPPVPGAAGCLQATLIFDPAISEKSAAQLLKQADVLLAAHCNLGERFEPTEREYPEFFQLEVRFDPAPGAQASTVFAAIFSAVKQALIPGPQFLTLEQGLATGIPIDQALEGPRLQHGILAALPAPCSWLEAQERACQALLRVPGIKRLDSVNFQPPEGLTEPGFFAPLAQAAQPASLLLAAANETLGAASMAIQFGQSAPANLASDAAATAATAPRSGAQAGALAVSQAQDFIEAGGESPAVQFSSLLSGNDWAMPPAPPPADQRVGDYFSIQHQFPRLFRLEASALQADAPDQDIVAVRQLKGYLLPFEQLMANYFAQLGHVADFFSNLPQERTVFTQPLADVPDALPLFVGGESFQSPADYWADLANPYISGLESIAEDSARFRRRRQRVLDHLLARFNESFPTDDRTTYETTANKEALLRSYPRLGLTRSQSAPPCEPAARAAEGAAARPRSGLEHKIQLLLRRDLQSGPTRVGDLDGTREAARPDDFYFVFEPVRFLPRKGSAPAENPANTVAFVPADFGPQLFHVFLNWTYQKITPALRSYSEALVLENAPAHLWHRFIWIETISPAESRPDALFLSLVQAWIEAGMPSLEAVGLASTDSPGLQALADTPAARILGWLKENAPE